MSLPQNLSFHKPYRGLKKNTLQLKTLFALSNLWMVRHQLLGVQG
jgi:IS5 family transposase